MSDLSNVKVGDFFVCGQCYSSPSILRLESFTQSGRSGRFSWVKMKSEYEPIHHNGTHRVDAEWLATSNHTPSITRPLKSMEDDFRNGELSFYVVIDKDYYFKSDDVVNHVYTSCEY